MNYKDKTKEHLNDPAENWRQRIEDLEGRSN